LKLEVTVRKRGNKHFIYLPKLVVLKGNIEEGDKMQIELVDSSVTISHVPKDSIDEMTESDRVLSKISRFNDLIYAL
jgi:antitoxin component of MazEF toxin-antitoxin module